MGAAMTGNTVCSEMRGGNVLGIVGFILSVKNVIVNNDNDDSLSRTHCRHAPRFLTTMHYDEPIDTAIFELYIIVANPSRCARGRVEVKIC
jgi:hypothetical protein